MKTNCGTYLEKKIPKLIPSFTPFWHHSPASFSKLTIHTTHKIRQSMVLNNLLVNNYLGVAGHPEDHSPTVPAKG